MFQMWIPRAIELCLPFLDVESNISKQIPVFPKNKCTPTA
jgi:hypothetical protein